MIGYWTIVGGIMLTLAVGALLYRLMGARYR